VSAAAADVVEGDTMKQRFCVNHLENKMGHE
jgi:hypothetical protein